MKTSNVQPHDRREGEAQVAPFYGHGGRLSLARERYPQAPAPWLDLSTGVAPWPYSIPGLGFEAWTRLPEPHALEGLQAAARAYYGVPDGMRIATVPGTDLAIGLIPRLVAAPARVAVVAPTYGSHAQAWQAAGHDVREVDAPGGIGDGEIGVVVNPNNPDGRRWDPALLRALAARLANSGGLLVIDEAFADADPGVSVLDAGIAVPGAVVLRSFGKFFGLAGMRLGFVISSHEIAGHIIETAGAWPVSGPAVAAGTRAFSDGPWAAGQRRRLHEASARLATALAGAGLKAAGGTAFFQLIEHPPAAHLFDHLARHGILVRPFAKGQRLRFGLPAGEEAWVRLHEALNTWTGADLE